MDSAASLATQAKIVASGKLQGCMKLQTRGNMLSKIPREGARCSQNKSEKDIPFAWQVPGYTHFTWLLICELEYFKQGEEERKGNTHSELQWQTQGSDKHQ